MLPITYSDKWAPKAPSYLVKIKDGSGREGSIYFKKTINTCQEKSLRQSKSKDTFFMSFDEDKNYTVSRFVFTSTNKNINLSY